MMQLMWRLLLASLGASVNISRQLRRRYHERVEAWCRISL